MLNEEKLRQYIKEELSKTEVRNIIDSKIADFLKAKELETRVSEVVSDVFEKFFRMMYNKRGFWKNDIKR